jgi:hypothetical protein
MQENNLKDDALIKIQSLIWHQKKLINELENNLDEDEDIELVEMMFNKSLNKLEVLEFMKKAIQNYEY